MDSQPHLIPFKSLSKKRSGTVRFGGGRKRVLGGYWFERETEEEELVVVNRV